MIVSRRFQQIMLACALATAVAACSSGGSSSSGASSAPATSAPASSAPASAASGGSAASAIAANWAAFFSAKTPVAKRVTLLQDGKVFASIIKAQAGSGLASQATAKVSKVTVQSASKAKVTYSILLGGTPALANQTGVAVYQDGTWKVGLASFCGLLTVENNGNKSSLPALCKSAG